MYWKKENLISSIRYLQLFGDGSKIKPHQGPKKKIVVNRINRISHSKNWDPIGCTPPIAMIRRSPGSILGHLPHDGPPRLSRRHPLRCRLTRALVPGGAFVVQLVVHAYSNRQKMGRKEPGMGPGWVKSPGSLASKWQDMARCI